MNLTSLASNITTGPQLRSALERICLYQNIPFTGDDIQKLVARQDEIIAQGRQQHVLRGLDLSQYWDIVAGKFVIHMADGDVEDVLHPSTIVQRLLPAEDLKSVAHITVYEGTATFLQRPNAANKIHELFRYRYTDVAHVVQLLNWMTIIASDNLRQVLQEASSPVSFGLTGASWSSAHIAA